MYYLLWSTVRDSFEAHGDTLSKGVRIVVTLFEITVFFILCSTSTVMQSGSGEPGLDFAVLKTLNGIMSLNDRNL